MAEFNNIMEVFKLLKKTNCRKCNKPTCLTFAASVFQGQIALKECPFIGEDILKEYGSQKIEYESSFEQDYIKMMGQLKDQIKLIDLEAKAQKLSGKFSNGRLILKILGKDFSIDKNEGDLNRYSCQFLDRCASDELCIIQQNDTIDRVMGTFQGT